MIQKLKRGANPYTDAGATALDDVDGDITSNIITTNNVNPNVIGNYTVDYSVTDTAGLTTMANRTVNVVDTTLPVIIIIGNNPISHEVGNPYTDEGAYALDDVDGDITSSIIIINNVNPNVVGTYTVDCEVTDTAGNTAIANRTVNVVGSTMPPELWHQNTGIIGTNEVDDNFGSAVSSGDFNNDGFIDLAIGIPGETHFSSTNAGSVSILYGKSGGLDSTGIQPLHQNSYKIPGVNEVGDNFGSAVSSGDFNNDGFIDLAIGIPGETLGPNTNTGSVTILYGTSGGLDATGNQIWHQNKGIRGSNEVGDNFGSALASGDFNNDGFIDLAIGIPGETIATETNAGSVTILYGTSTGLANTDNQLWHRSQGLIGSNEVGDNFGSALASGDFNNDGFIDLAIGIPGESFNFNTNAGSVQIIYGTSSGLGNTDDQLWHQNQGLIGSNEVGDNFGSALASGDFNNDGFIDLAIGIPGETIDSNTNTGSVTILYGTSGGLASTGNQLWHQDSGINGSNEVGDNFGSAVSSGDFNNDGFTDLAIGIPGETIDSNTNTGSVTILYGTSGGLASTSNQAWNQNEVGIPGANEVGDNFGSAVSSGDFNNDGFTDLAIGIPGETIDSNTDTGSVIVIYQPL